MRDFFKNILLIGIGAIFSHFGQQYYYAYENQIQYLDYKIEQSIGFLSKPNLPDHDVKIMVDDKVTETLSKFTISIFNYSDKDYSNVPIYINIITKDGKKTSVIGEYAVGENNIPEMIKKIPNLEPNHEKEVIRYGYNLSSVNRTEKLSPVFQVNFLIEGKEIPDIKVYTNYAGLKIREFDYNNISHFKNIKLKQLVLLLVIIVGGSLGYIILIALLIRLINLFFPTKKIKQKQVEKLTNSLSQKLSINQLSENQRRDIIADIIYQQDKNKWDRINKNKLIRWLTGEKEPVRNQYTEDKRDSN
ncbi:MAG: hypothetical protein HZA00_02720 [Nitrospinae bacterium]|nr:hypothetical protein [Nitrospinota bacterium]